MGMFGSTLGYDNLLTQTALVSRFNEQLQAESQMQEDESKPTPNSFSKGFAKQSRNKANITMTG